MASRWLPFETISETCTLFKAFKASQSSEKAQAWKEVFSLSPEVSSPTGEKQKRDLKLRVTKVCMLVGALWLPYGWVSFLCLNRNCSCKLPTPREALSVCFPRLTSFRCFHYTYFYLSHISLPFTWTREVPSASSLIKSYFILQLPGKKQSHSGSSLQGWEAWATHLLLLVKIKSAKCWVAWKCPVKSFKDIALRIASKA